MVDIDNVIKVLQDALTAKENFPWARAEMSFEFIEMLLELLKEQEAVVHCKDCIWYDKEDPGYTTGICKMNDRMFPKEHFFCAHGFKRSEDDE